MIDRTHALKVSRQCELLDLQGSNFFYYQLKADHSKSLELMRKIDALYLNFPWMGSRSIRDQLVRDCFNVCRDRVRGLMRKMDIHAIYRAPRTSIAFRGHKINPICSKML